MNMDVVKAFNNELLGLYEVKPPISKAKMTNITKTAIRAIKFYKHVVQSVEKFILKCKPDYKVPGLYVIDAIVRQSRNQFGPDKDVFAPRFAKNMSLTFSNLFSCPPEEKGKIIRVLNLWQKNQVFTPDVIQPLFDQLADPNNPIHRETSVPSNGLSMVEKTPPYKTGIPNMPTSKTKSPGDSNRIKFEAAKTFQELSSVAAKITNQQKTSPGIGAEFMQQWQHLQNLLLASPQKQDNVMFDKKILDFDYGDEDDENTSPHAANTSSDQQFNKILQNPDVLRSLSVLQLHMAQANVKQHHYDEEKMRKLKEMKEQEVEFDKHLAQTVPKLPFASECDFKAIGDLGMTMTSGLGKHDMVIDDNNSDVECLGEGINTDLMSREGSVTSLGDDSRHNQSSPMRHRRRRSRSRSRSRSQKRSRRHRSRSRSRQRHRERDREKDKERDIEMTKEKERRKKGLPPIKKNHLSVCSTTLWIGHLSKLVQQENLSDTFGEYGDIVSIDLIPPRGCAFVCMNRRQDAARALNRLQSHKIHGKTITLAWAPGKGVKGRELKDFWEIELGVSYIPWHCLNPGTNFADLEEGGALDEETMPENLKPIIIEQLKKYKGPVMGNPLNPGFMPTAADVMSVMPGLLPPPGMANAQVAPNIDTSQPPPNIGGGKVGVGMPQMAGKSGLILPPPFAFANLPPPMGLNMPNMMGNMSMVPPPMPGLILQQPIMHPGVMPPMATQQDDSSNKDKDDDNMDLDDSGDGNNKKFRDNRDWGRSRDIDDRRNSRDDRKDRDRRDRDRGRDRHRDRRDRGGRSSNRSRSRDADLPNRSRDRRNRDRSKDEKRDDASGTDEKKGLTPWVEVAPAGNNSAEKPSLMQRLRNIAEGGGGGGGGGGAVGLEPPPPPPPTFSTAMDDRQGPPIVMNLNNSGPRSLFGSRGPDAFQPCGPLFNDNRRIRPPFNGPGFDEMGPGPLPGPGPGPDDVPMFHNEMMFDSEGPLFDRRPNRSRFDGPRPLMGSTFDEPPADMMMMGGPPMFMDDFPHPGGGGGGGGGGGPRMRFGPRGRGGAGFGPRGPRPLMSRPLPPWMDAQGPPNERPRSSFEDRVSRERRNSGRRRDRDGPRASRWGREDNKDENSSEISMDIAQEENHDAQPQQQQQQPQRDAQTPVFDEQPPAFNDDEQHINAPCEFKADLPDNDLSMNQNIDERKSSNPGGGSTPCHDEPSDSAGQDQTE